MRYRGKHRAPTRKAVKVARIAVGGLALAEITGAFSAIPANAATPTSPAMLASHSGHSGGHGGGHSGGHGGGHSGSGHHSSGHSGGHGGSHGHSGGGHGSSGSGHGGGSHSSGHSSSGHSASKPSPQPHVAKPVQAVAHVAPAVAPAPATPPAPQDPAPQPEPAAAPDFLYDHYIVQEGDNLTQIAAAFNLSWDAVWAANSDTIDHPDLLYPGQVLRLPA